jgi:hypothetical protein
MLTQHLFDIEMPTLFALGTDNLYTEVLVASVEIMY